MLLTRYERARHGYHQNWMSILLTMKSRSVSFCLRASSLHCGPFNPYNFSECAPNVRPAQCRMLAPVFSFSLCSLAFRLTVRMVNCVLEYSTKPAPIVTTNLYIPLPLFYLKNKLISKWHALRLITVLPFRRCAAYSQIRIYK